MRSGNFCAHFARPEASTQNIRFWGLKADEPTITSLAAAQLSLCAYGLETNKNLCWIDTMNLQPFLRKILRQLSAALIWGLLT